MKRHLLVFLLTVISFGFVGAQKKIVIIGSSTAAGMGANPYSMSWAGRLQSYYQQNMTPGDPDTIVTNLAVGGQYTFSCMPTSYTPPPGYPLVNPNGNITAAIALNPDVIIVNLPSNDQVWPFPKWMSMNNFRTIFNEAVNANKRIFITTTQPINNLDLTIRDSLRKMVDSIKNNFGAFSIDFWTPIRNPVGDSTIRPDLNSDGTHVNNDGHALLFQAVIAKDLFPAAGPLPLKLLSFEAVASDKSTILKWTTTEEEPNTKFEIQRSADGREFESLANLDAVGSSGNINYTWIDQRPLDGKSFYRLKINESSKTSYSRVVMVDNKTNAFNITSVYLDATNLNINLKGYKGNSLELSLINLSGAMVKKQKLNIANTDKLAIPIGDIPAGEYILRLVDNNGNTDTQRFTKLK